MDELDLRGAREPRGVRHPQLRPRGGPRRAPPVGGRGGARPSRLGPEGARADERQAYAFVLYSFAWWPIEAMLATKEIDPVADAKGIEDWFHFWSVAGYGMGVPEALLPRDFATARRTVALLRRAQYPAPGEPRPAGIPVLLGGNVRMLATLFPGAKPPAGDEAHLPSAPKEPEAKTVAAARSLAGLVALSPGLADALGLGPDPVARLVELAALPAPKG